ncbi:MAG: GTPase Era [Desulfobacterales bacterium]|jgi:GTP-binding protein Era|nr:GTPase Era [Desulfobacterales bacterium]
MSATPHASAFKSGVVTIAGAPNAGKSTLLNRILGEKVSIISSRPQTTRNRILGVCHRPGAQILFYDTPGIFAAGDRFNTRIVDAAFSAFGDADVILAVVDAAQPDRKAEELLAQQLRTRKGAVIIALNKVDLITEKGTLLEMIRRWSARCPCEAVVPISALDGTQVETLVAALIAALPEGPAYFPEETLTDATERFIAAELIREKVFRLTGEEVPYATAVTVEAFKPSADGKRVNIEATIHLERDSQKGIVIGKGGAMLKRIGTEARREIEQMIQARVFLKLFVRVQKNWRRDAKAIERFGY